MKKYLFGAVLVIVKSNYCKHICVLVLQLLLSTAAMGQLYSNLRIPTTVKKIIINAPFTNYQFHDGMLAVENRETGNWGFVNEQGVLVHDFIWKSPRLFSTPKFGGNACVVKRMENGKDVWYVIDNLGKSIRIPGIIKSVSDYCGGYARAVKMMGGKARVVFLNSKGQEVFPGLSYNAAIMEEVTSPFPFSEGLACYYDKTKRKYGYINTSGRIVIAPIYLEVRDFSEGLAAVRVSTSSGERWGFVDKVGKWVIPAKFSEEPYPFIEGYSSVRKTNKSCVAINRQGDPVSIEFSDIRQFHNGYAFVHEQGRQFASLIDKNFNIVKRDIKEAQLHAHERFSNFLNYQNDCCVLKGNTGGWSIFNYVGEFLTSIPYATFCYNKLLSCMPGGLYGVPYSGFIDYNGNYIFMFVEGEF